MKKPRINKFQCDECDYKAHYAGRLKQHKESVHQGIRHKCDMCDYTATRPEKVKLHKQSVHEGIRFTCNLCNYQASRKEYLKLHYKSKTEQPIRHENLPKLVSKLADIPANKPIFKQY